MREIDFKIFMMIELTFLANIFLIKQNLMILDIYIRAIKGKK